MLPLIASLVPVIGGIIDKVIPDTAAKDKAKAELAKLEQNGELDLLMGQLKINMEEAKSESVFVAGWRPFTGWVCGSSLAWEFVIKPFTVFASIAFDLLEKEQVDQIPDLDMSVMMPVLLGMLGLGGMRSFEKWKGANKNR